MKRSTLYIVVIVLLILSGLFGYYIGKNDTSMPLVSRPTRIDSVDHIIRTKPIPTADVVQPIARTVGQPDTAARKRAEKAKIITAVVRRRDFLDITTIDIKGVSQIETFVILPEIEFRVDSSGTVGVDPKAERKARNKLKFKNTAKDVLHGTEIVIGFVAGIFLGSKL